MVVGAAEVEAWLDDNWAWTEDYILRQIDITLINKWLMMHGFHTIQDYIITGRRESMTPDPVSPEPRSTDTPAFFISEADSAPRPLRLPPQRSNSKKYLRHDFARGRLRGIFRTCEGVNLESKLEQRRNSLKCMRQFLSLPPTSGNILSMLIQSKVRLPRYASIDEELKRQLRMVNERDFTLEIVKDISHDLDLKSLTGRILVNICILMDADRSSLFFVEGKKGKEQLVSKVFDAYTGTNCVPTCNGDNVVRVPWGTGIIGYVASSGDPVNIIDANKDPRYNDAADRSVSYNADSLLCMPVRNGDEEIIGVAQVINKKTQPGYFNMDDEKALEMYLTFCGMAISNAQAIESYTREYDRNKGLLEVVHDLFEEQTSVDNVVTKIMQRAQTLLKCERCLVMLKDEDEYSCEREGFSRVFELQRPSRNGHVKPSGSPVTVKARPKEETYRRRNTVGCLPGNITQTPLVQPINKRRGTVVQIPDGAVVTGQPNLIAEIVASTGETINIPDAHLDPRCNATRDESSGFYARSVLCKPIKNNKGQTIGVAQLINRADGKPFDSQDEQLFEAFTIFCGLGINNCMLYDELARSSAKQAVALEVLSYHATAPVGGVLSFKNTPVPQAVKWGLQRLDFNDFLLDNDQMVIAAVRMFKDSGVLKTFKIDYETLIRWLLTVRKNYRNIAYHNWRHAFNVCQVMFALLTTCAIKRHLSDREALALLVGCLCHDLDHRGTNNAFQQKSSSALSQLYGTEATLEHHHFNHAVIILNSDGHNIFANLTSDDYSEVMLLLKAAILATDLSEHLQIRATFFPLVESNDWGWKDDDQRALLRDILMTACDIGSITKGWEVQRRVADLVVAEFLEQGDKERHMLKIQPQALMDRERQDELPQLQMDWIDGICLPLYQHLTKMDAVFEQMVERVLGNRAHWEVLEAERHGQKRVVKETNV